MRHAVMLAGAIGMVLLLRGCAVNGDASLQKRERGVSDGRVLFDFDSGTTSRAHCTVVDDPFGEAGKVIVGEVVEKGYNKTSFFNDEGFFFVPPEWRGEVVLCYAVRKEAKMRVALVSEAGKVKSYYFEAPALNAWVEAILLLKHLQPKISPGEKIVDVSIWQQGGGTEGALYVAHARLRTD